MPRSRRPRGHAHEDAADRHRRDGGGRNGDAPPGGGRGGISKFTPYRLGVVEIGNIDDAEAFTTLDGSSIREVAGRASLPSSHQSLAEATVPAGGATTAHYHRASEELYFFTAGSGRLRVGADERDVRAGDCAVIPPGVEHKLRNTGEEPLVLLCCCAPPYSHDDTVLTE